MSLAMSAFMSIHFFGRRQRQLAVNRLAKMMSMRVSRYAGAQHRRYYCALLPSARFTSLQDVLQLPSSSIDLRRLENSDSRTQTGQGISTIDYLTQSSST